MLWFNIGAEGSTNDSEIYRTSDFKRKLEDGEIQFPLVSPEDTLKVPYHILGDMGFALSETVFTVRKAPNIILWTFCKRLPLLFQPYPYTTNVRKEKMFNWRHSRARITSECTFGILCSRFRVLKKPILQSYGNGVKTVLACIALHNYLRERMPTDDVPPQVRTQMLGKVSKM